MSKQLLGKVIVITGASKGMGRAFTRALVDEGAKIVALARPSTELNALAVELGPDLLALPCDIRDAEAVTAAIAQAASHFGRIDGVVNNAGIVTLLQIETADDDEIRRLFDTNLFGAIHVTRAAIPHLRAAGGGDIVFMSSESVRFPFPLLAYYAASKAALESLAAALRQELRGDGSRITVVRSGAVESGDSIRSNFKDETRERFVREGGEAGFFHFSGTPATPETMAKVIVGLFVLPRDVNLDLIEARARAPQSL